MIDASFRLREGFINKYRHVTAPFGFNGFGELVYLRTYSRPKEDGTNEQWFETVRRVVEGCYRMQERHIKGYHLGWNKEHAQRSAQEMFDRMFNFKFTPPGRGLWAMGSAITEEKELYAALNNCAFVSTDSLEYDREMPFLFLMDMSMLGVGVGFDVLGEKSFDLREPGSAGMSIPEVRTAASEGLLAGLYPSFPSAVDTTDWQGNPVTYSYLVQPDGKFIVPDTREGWVVAVMLALAAFFRGHGLPDYDLSLIRPENLPIKGFGGVSSGPQALRDLLDDLIGILSKRIDQPISKETIADVMNLIGRCVVAGNVRRTAEIMFGDPDDPEYLDLKNYRWDPETFTYKGPRADRSGWGWTSNNSVFAREGMDYANCAHRTWVNGEPGYAWLENMRNYGRMNGILDQRDIKAKGGNPCLEQTLESYELCCLVETYPTNHDSIEDYERTLKFAYLYAKTVTLGRTHWEPTNRVMLKNRRIGCSMSGLTQFMHRNGVDTLKQWCNKGYDAIQKFDEIYSNWFAIPRSIKTTSIKPSGTVSLLAGVTPGMHFTESRWHIRRMRLAKNSDLIGPLMSAGYKVEPCVGQEESTVVVEFPIAMEEGLRSVSEVSMWEQLALAALLQREWADNQVSCTVTFDPITEGPQIKNALDFYQYQLKGVSFLPKLAAGAYAQMPYEEITEERYHEIARSVQPVTFGQVSGEDADVERFCDGGKCTVAIPG